jgi:methylated-DNA-[protein]-cysteine S-methyltransferase
MLDVGCCLFPTAIGTCAIAWNADTIAAVALPEASDAETLARIHARVPDATPATPPPFVADVIRAITALLDGSCVNGSPIDLSQIPLDLSGVPEFHRRAYAIAQSIPPGETMTYGEIAKRLGEPGAARAVGQAMGANRFPIIVPCHRVLAAGRKTGGFSARGGVTTKLRMLDIEGALAEADGLPFAHLPLQARPPTQR